ncbi:MAG TPA: hypothetical protein VFS60_01250 [Thermoanaerobaculia bacterium]|nr:hypothetical protein [Thermoanaerobaculia bacterium]
MGIRAIAASAVCWLTFMVTGIPAHGGSMNIANPGCETAGSPPPSWTQVTGNWSCGAFPNPPPQGGTAYFRPGDNASAELRQDIPVSDSATVATIDWGLATAEFRGYVRSFSQTPVDFSRIVIEYRDAANVSVLSSFDSGNLSSVATWSLVADTRPIPAGTRTIRIRLISTRQNGTSNDGYYDDLALDIKVPKLSCYSDAECHLVGCVDCSCIALAVGARLPPKCQDPHSACIRDPCLNKVAACDVGKCVVKTAPSL